MYASIYIQGSILHIVSILTKSIIVMIPLAFDNLDVIIYHSINLAFHMYSLPIYK